MSNFTFASPIQIRAARSMLNWSVHELGKKIGVAGTTISAIERQKISGSIPTLQNITISLQSAGIEFLPDDGIRPSKNRIRILKGEYGLKIFYEEIYSAAENGDARICVIAPNIAKFRTWNTEHIKRREGLQLKTNHPQDRYLYPNTHKDNIPVNYEDARYLPPDNFPDVCIHIHGDKTTTIEFLDDDIQLVITENPTVANSFRKLFNMLWNQASLSPE